jgi:hypothetical protein
MCTLPHTCTSHMRHAARTRAREAPTGGRARRRRRERSRSRSLSPVRRGSARPQTEFITEFSLGGDGGQREHGAAAAAAGPRERRPASGGDAEDRAARAQQCAPRCARTRLCRCISCCVVLLCFASRTAASPARISGVSQRGHVRACMVFVHYIYAGPAASLPRSWHMWVAGHGVKSEASSCRRGRAAALTAQQHSCAPDARAGRA